VFIYLITLRLIFRTHFCHAKEEKATKKATDDHGLIASDLTITGFCKTFFFLSSKS